MIRRLQNAFYKSGLLGEFLDTIINDGNEVMSRKLLRQVWTMVSTEWPLVDEVLEHVVRTFADSTGELDLDTSWRRIVTEYWSKLPDMPLKNEIDKL